MHLWEVATLEAIGKKIGFIREVDEETGSVCVTVNGFNPIIFKLVVPFDFGDEVVVTLEYEKLLGYCDNCCRLTHEEKACQELIKVAGDQAFGNQVDNRGGLRQQGLVKQGLVHNDGGWEKPRKHVKRALDFQSYDASGVGNSGSYQQDRHQGSVWEQKRSHGSTAMGFLGGKREVQIATGEHMGHVSSFPLNRKGSGLV
ncbi:PREDICTED: uncharacterized protein LOC104723009 [Camelina sativa]|uniref:Uncharacterized protein LOC104723009 n=1 Tax=Camelina sativa TaxID=90675 RepID=A0ABM0UDK9_CAMSA|nr:PREDICTED: uncharacterized protein LOC104723009 [Camelina sativa]